MYDSLDGLKVTLLKNIETTASNKTYNTEPQEQLFNVVIKDGKITKWEQYK